MGKLTIPDFHMSGGSVTVECETSEVSDGYHTFGELYDHRCALFLLLCNQNPDISFKSRKHGDGASWDGWFVLWMETEHGQISYHLPEILWNKSSAQELERVKDFDGHSSKDVLERLWMLAEDSSKPDD